MLIELLTAIDTGRQTLAAGVIVDLPDDEAGRIIVARLAKPVDAGGANPAPPAGESAIKPKRKG